jgi:hypothetical protein
MYVLLFQPYGINNIIKNNNMKEFMYNLQAVNIKIARYGNGRKAIQLYSAVDKMPVMTATLNASAEEVDIEDVVIKDYSENMGIYEWLLSKNIIEQAHALHELAFDSVPVCKLLPEEEWHDESFSYDQDLYDFID